jgi:ABC-type amino acid transport system permease subunit
MTNHPDHEPRRTRIIVAAITGITAGISRAVASWLIEHLTTSR